MAETLPNLLEALVLTGFDKLASILAVTERIPVTKEIQWLEINDSNEELEQVEPISFD